MTLLRVCVLIGMICGLMASDIPRPMTENALIKEYFKKLEESSYNTDVLPEPSDGHGSPVNVVCTMYIIDVSKVDDHSRDFDVQFYFRQRWNDSRLAFADQDIHKIIINDPTKIWVPDLFFVQEKEGFHHNLVKTNAVIRIDPDGEVLYSVRLSMTLSCPMNLRKYPHDVQQCNFTVESYGFTSDKLYISWDPKRPGAVGYSVDIDIPTFEIISIEEGSSSIVLSSGLYTALSVTLGLQRKVRFFMIRLYVPFMFLVALSWLSFWIPPRMLSARVALLLFIMYLMVNISSGISNFIPTASYTKGSDVWIAVCETLVFAAFLEFIAVYVITRNKEKLGKKSFKNDPEDQKVLDLDGKGHSMSVDASSFAASIVACRLKRICLVSERIDKLSRIVFPVLFLIFNFIYWLVYCTGHK